MTNQASKSSSSDEIDLIELIRHLWVNRKLIIRITSGFIILGLTIALLSPKEFKSEAKLLPEVLDAGGNASALLRQFGGLGGLGGINLPLGEGADAIRPDLYPDVIKSTPFYIALMQHTITFTHNGIQNQEELFIYLTEYTSQSIIGITLKYTFKLPWTILEWVRGWGEDELAEATTPQASFTKLNRDQFEVIKDLSKRISSTIDMKTGIITISAQFPDPFVAAQVADFAVNYLTNYITAYRIEKVQKNLEFIMERHTEKELEYNQAQNALASFRDANKNVILASTQMEEQRLQNQANLAFNIYNGLSQQLEQARIKVQEETPVIKVLEPVQVPVERSKPRRSLILVVFTFLGGFMGVGFVFGKLIWSNITQRLKTE